MARTKKPGERVKTTVTYLEMRSPPRRPATRAPLGKLAIMRAERPTVSFYRYLYNTIGEEWYWSERRQAGDEVLRAIIRHPEVWASVDPNGYIQIGDRVKDMVKSGGEWISSVDLETAIIAHPGVLEAAVIAIPHERWVERPLACVVPNAEFKGKLDKAEVLDFIRDKFASWWMPDDVVFIDEIPKTGVGKFDKKVLRERYKDYTAES